MAIFKRVQWTVAAVLLGCSCMSSLQAQNTAPLAARRDALNNLLAEEWEYELKQSPEMATSIGDYRYNDKLSDASVQHVRESAVRSRQWLARFEAIDTAGFPEQERLNQALMVRNLREGLEGYQLKIWEMPVSQMSGVHLDIAQFVPILPFNTTKQYEDYLARLKQVPRLFEQTITICEQGRQDKLMPPKFLLEKIPTQARAIGTPAGEANVFASPLKHFPETSRRQTRSGFTMRFSLLSTPRCGLPMRSLPTTWRRRMLPRVGPAKACVRCRTAMRFTGTRLNPAPRPRWIRRPFTILA